MTHDDESNAPAREAKYGEKMIEVKVRFWTNDIAPDDQIQPGHAWTGGVVRIVPNKSHGISSGDATPFNSLLEIGSAIEKVLIDHGIVLYPSNRMKKYVHDRPETPSKKQ
jgi:hypothetical protein